MLSQYPNNIQSRNRGMMRSRKVPSNVLTAKKNSHTEVVCQGTSTESIRNQERGTTLIVQNVPHCKCCHMHGPCLYIVHILAYCKVQKIGKRENLPWPFTFILFKHQKGVAMVLLLVLLAVRN